MEDEIRTTGSTGLDDAIAARLARLAAAPVDTSRLDEALRAQLPQRRSQRRIFWLRPIQAAAATFILIGGIVAAVLLSIWGGPALASAVQMAQVHQDIVSGRIPIMQVASISEANQMLADKSPGSPSLPQMPDSHVMACCMKSVHDKKMACVLLREAGAAVTLAVANASDMKLPAVPITTRNGISYRVQSVHGLSMVMTERNGKWLCLISELSADRLMDIAAQIQF